MAGTSKSSISFEGRTLLTTKQVIGGGAVGLAIARRLAMRSGTSTVLIERNSAVGMETSSRNSEVCCTILFTRAWNFSTPNVKIDMFARSSTPACITAKIPSRQSFVSKEEKCCMIYVIKKISRIKKWGNGL